MNNIKKFFQIATLLLIISPKAKNANARILYGDNSYYYYFNLGGNIGSQNLSYYNINEEKIASMHEGFRSSGIIGGLNMSFGSEFRFAEKNIYFATEISTNIMFSNNVSAASIGQNVLLEWKSRLPDDDGFSTNSYQSFHTNLKLGYTGTNDQYAIFGILGFGGLFTGNVANIRSADPVILDLNSFSFAFGLGMNHFINENVGFFAQFLFLNGLKSDIGAPDFNVADIESFALLTYNINFGLTLRF